MKLILPRPISDVFHVSSPFGERTLEGKKIFHNGIDFACPIGTKVYAVADGIAVRSGWENSDNVKQGYGLRVMQNMTWGGVKFFCWYGHLSEPLVKEGDKIHSGQLIGLSGNTGHSTGPHLHFGIRKQDTQEFYDVEWQNEVRWEVA